MARRHLKLGLGGMQCYVGSRPWQRDACGGGNQLDAVPTEWLQSRGSFPTGHHDEDG
jgi:hypothetical protein